MATVHSIARCDGALAVTWHHLAFLTIVAAKARMSFKAKLAMQLEVRLAKVFWLATSRLFVTLLAITVFAEAAFHRIVQGKAAIGADGQMPIAAIKAVARCLQGAKSVAVRLLVLWTKPDMAAGRAAILVPIVETALLPTAPSPFVPCVGYRGLHWLLVPLGCMKAF